MKDGEKQITEQSSPRPCPKDCSKCSSQQQVFCSSQMCFYLVEKVSSVEKRLDAMIGQIDLLLLKLSENNSEGEVLINPIKDIIDDKHKRQAV